MSVTKETLKDGEILVYLKNEFLKNQTEDNLIPLMSCLHDSVVLVPMNLPKNNVSNPKPDILQNGKSFYLPVFSQEKQISKNYRTNLNFVEKTLLESIQIARNINADGLVLDPFTEHMIISFDIAEIIEVMPSQLED
ncbi:MAG: SseB family protein [Acetobacter sp.]|nr:SseB family protein [Bacteroides sp.]MCM1341714.1 SseB family protein [Acetobacter sp.]MCM1432347.1 SseB family protein [Clostridiales bacterium]